MHTKRILIVEDHEPTRDILRLIFRRKGWQTFVAGTVAEGLAVLGMVPPPTGLLLDLDLPDGRGEAVLRKVREDHLPIRVAVCTGMGDPSRWSKVQGLGPEALLQKPIDLADLCAALTG